MSTNGGIVEPGGRRPPSRGSSNGDYSRKSSREDIHGHDNHEGIDAGGGGAYLRATGSLPSSYDRRPEGGNRGEPRDYGGDGKNSRRSSRSGGGAIQQHSRGGQRSSLENGVEEGRSAMIEGFSHGRNHARGGVQDMTDNEAGGGEEHTLGYLDGTQDASPARSNSRGGGRRSSSGAAHKRPAVPSPQGDQGGSTSSDNDDETSVDFDSTPRGRRNESSRSSSFASPFNSTDDGGSVAGGGGGPQSADNGGSGGGAVRSIPRVSARPGNVPFGASALSKTLPNTGRGRPRGLRPRGSGSGASFGSSSSGRVNLVTVPSSRSRSGSTGGFASTNGRQSVNKAEEREREARAVAEQVAPGVRMEKVVRAAITIESVMRVLIARGYVRRKLVSEVTAFSLIMERGIEVIKHPYSGKAKPKNVTVNFVSRKGAMQLSWGGKGGVPLETIYGVTKGIKTEALARVVGPDRAENCFSLLTPDRTIDFEVDNPWLVLLVVRAMRLFLGAHYDTLPAPTFFSHLCVRPRGAARTDSPKQTLVWTGDDEKAPGKEISSTPTERTSGDSLDSDSDDAGAGGSGSGDRSPWARIEEARASGIGAGDDAAYPPASSTGGDTDAGSMHAATPPPPPEYRSHNGHTIEADGMRGNGDRAAEEEGLTNEEDGEHQRSPGGIMSLFSSGRRSGEYHVDLGGTASSAELGATGSDAGEPDEDQPLTASQVLATRGATKRLNLSKKLSGPKETALKGKRFNLMALPADGQQERRERGLSLDLENLPKRTQGMSISIGAGYNLPEEQDRTGDSGSHDPERIAIVDDLNDKLQSLRKLCVPQQRIGAYRPGLKQPKTMAVKHMAFFQGAGGSVMGGMGSVADMWGDGVRRQYQTDMVRQKNESVEDVRKRDDARTAMLVNRSGVHRVTRKASTSVEQR